MVSNHRIDRVDTPELKDLMYQKSGRQRAEKYFDQLNRFLALKLSKADFDKSCIQTIGRENVSLHNELIRSIIRNACRAKAPPSRARKVGLGVKVANGDQRTCLQSLCGDAFLHSPCKCRSPVNKDRKFRDHLSPLGPLGKSPSVTCEETVSRIQEESAAEMHSPCSRPPMNVTSVEEGEEVEQVAGIPSSRRWSSVTAPFGVSVNMFGARKALDSGFSYHSFAEDCQSSGKLPDTISLRSRLQKKLASEGVGVSLESANLLNNSLDVFLKRLIQRLMQMSMQPSSASMLDFRVVMESDPSILGEDWPVQLEKICHYTIE